MIKTAYCDTFVFGTLLSLVHSICKEGKVPQEWADAVLVPIPKKGNLKSCDNWRGIALLDVVGKIVASILQERLQKLAEDVFPESQCGCSVSFVLSGTAVREASQCTFAGQKDNAKSCFKLLPQFLVWGA